MISGDDVDAWLDELTVDADERFGAGAAVTTLGLMISASDEARFSVRLEASGQGVSLRRGPVDDLGLVAECDALSLMLSLAHPQTLGSQFASSATLRTADGEEHSMLPFPVPERALLDLPFILGATFTLHITLHPWLLGDLDFHLSMAHGQLSTFAYGTPGGRAARVATRPVDAVQFVQGEVPVTELLAAGALFDAAAHEMSVIQGVLQSEEYCDAWRPLAGLTAISRRLAEVSESKHAQRWREHTGSIARRHLQNAMPAL